MANVSTVRYSRISANGLTVTVEYDDGTFVTDHPIVVRPGPHDVILYDNPEKLPDFVFPAVAEIIRFTREYESAMSHNHPNWSHDRAYGPCTIPSNPNCVHGGVFRGEFCYACGRVA